METRCCKQQEVEEDDINPTQTFGGVTKAMSWAAGLMPGCRGVGVVGTVYAHRRSAIQGRLMRLDMRGRVGGKVAVCILAWLWRWPIIFAKGLPTVAMASSRRVTISEPLAEEEDNEQQRDQQRVHKEGEEANAMRFDTLCQVVLSSVVDVDTSIAEFGLWKDELLTHVIPANVMLRLLVAYSKMHRASMLLHAPLLELVRLVKLYSQKWNRKSEALVQLRDDYEKNKRHLSVALNRITQSRVDVERAKKERLLMNWERLFAKMLSYRKHSRRWQFLIDSFHELMREGRPIIIESDSDDDSDDESTTSEKLPQKATSRRGSKNFPLRRQSDLLSAGLEEAAKLRDENKTLREKLDNALSLKPRTHAASQTTGDVFVGANKKTPFKTDLNSMFMSCGNGDLIGYPIVIRVKSIRGLGDIVPPELQVVLEVFESGSTKYKDRASTTVLPTTIADQDAITFDQKLLLNDILDGDTVHVQLVAGLAGPKVMAQGLIPAELFVDAINGQVKTRPAEGVAVNTLLNSALVLTIRATPEYIEFRHESMPSHSEEEKNGGPIFIEFGSAIVDESVDSAETEQQLSLNHKSLTEPLHRGTGRRRNQYDAHHAIHMTLR